MSLSVENLALLNQTAGVMMRVEEKDGRQRYAGFARQDAAFHDRIMQFAGNELIRRTLALQHAHFHIFRLMFHTRVTEEALEEHAAILSAFAARDPQAARRAMHTHIERCRDRLLAAFD